MTYYYVNTGGSDSNPGTVNRPWKTVAHVNLQTFNAGDHVFFQAGQTFTGPLKIGGSGCICNGSVGAPVVFGSYGGGRATISTTGAVNGALATNTGNFGFNNLIFVGDNSDIDGVLVQNTDTVTNNKLSGVSLANLDVSNYGFNGIRFIGGTGASNSAGFTASTISGCVCHGCGGNHTAGGGAGITLTGQYGSGITNPTHTSITITGCTAHDNTGTSGSSNWTGSGIVIGECSGCIIQFCAAYNNGANNSGGNGPVGIWMYDCIGCIIQFCESYNNLSSTVDGGGFDMDGGCENCITQYCYAHGNYGPGFLVDAYNDGQVTQWLNNTIRFCIGQNNNTSGVVANQGELEFAVGSAFGAAYVYNNTFYNNSATSPVIYYFRAGNSGVFGNNIIYSGGGAPLIDTGGALPGETFSGNDYYTTGSFSIKWHGTTYTSLASWGQDSSGTTANPLLSNPGGGGTVGGYAPPAPTAYRFSAGSPMIGAGVNLNQVFGINVGNQDYYGDAVTDFNGNYDIGAYTYPGALTMMPSQVAFS